MPSGSPPPPTPPPQRPGPHDSARAGKGKDKPDAGAPTSPPGPPRASLASSLLPMSGGGMLSDLASGLTHTAKSSQFSQAGPSSQAFESAGSTPFAPGDAQHGSAMPTGAAGPSGGVGASFRSFLSGGGHQHHVPSDAPQHHPDAAYSAFSTAPAFGPASREGLGLGPNRNRDLVIPQVSSGQTQAGHWEQAWNSAQTWTPTPYQPGSQPAAAQQTRPSDQDFLSLLEQEEQVHGAVPQGPLSSIPDAAVPAPGSGRAPAAAAAAAAPSRFLTQQVGLGRQHVAPAGYQPPEPGVDTISSEQAALHTALDTLQHSDQPDRVAERIVPPPDNEALHQGVYALSDQEALREIVGGPGAVAGLNTQLERQAQTAREETERQQKQRTSSSQWDRLRSYLPRGTYVDEVYNLPPLLAKTLAEAEKKPEETDSPDDEDRRRTAIRRLDTLRQHLEPVQPGPPVAVDVWDMEKLLQQLDNLGK